MTRVLFVCTGNIFRSMTAEFALRDHLSDRSNILISSAGTSDFPHAKVRDDVAGYLLSKGLDVSNHQRQTVSERHVRESDLLISMNNDHKEVLWERFAVQSQLFTEACGKEAETMPDVDDLFPVEDRHGPEAQQHIYQTIDKIIALTPLLAQRLRS